MEELLPANAGLALFGSERAGKQAAVIQSRFATAQLNGIEPAAWLKDTLEKLPVWTMRQIDAHLLVNQQYKFADLKRWRGRTLGATAKLAPR